MSKLCKLIDIEKLLTLILRIINSNEYDIELL